MAAVNFPSNPNNNDTFSANGVVYTYNDTKGIWVVSATYNTTQNIIPAANVTYSLGNVTHRWKDLYLSGDTLVLGDVAVKAANGSIAVSNVEANGYVVPAETPVGSGGGTSYGANTDSTTFFALPTGNVAERDAGTANGHIRVNTEYSTLELFYNGNWSNIVFIGRITATGGDSVTTLNGFKIHTFTSSGTFIVQDTPPAGAEVEYLIVAGGGGGGAWVGAGGGAGGFVTGTASVSTTSYPIIVGAGGAGEKTQNAPSTPYPILIAKANGGNSQFSSYVAHGGGAGAGYETASRSGGSGGGGGGGAPVYPGNIPGAAGISPQGNSGGNGGVGISGPITSYRGGGGGGSGGPGFSANNTHSGSGGIGQTSSISGVSVYYSGGGGGGDNSAAPAGGPGAGGLGGGGAGCAGPSVVIAEDGDANTGGGGGGSGVPGANPFSQGGTGGSGIVIIKYRVA